MLMGSLMWVRARHTDPSLETLGEETGATMGTERHGEEKESSDRPLQVALMIAMVPVPIVSVSVTDRQSHWTECDWVNESADQDGSNDWMLHDFLAGKKKSELSERPLDGDLDTAEIDETANINEVILDRCRDSATVEGSLW